MLQLKANTFDTNESKSNTLCNTGENKTLLRFMAKFPVLRKFRIRRFGCTNPNENELRSILNRELTDGWLHNCVFNALNYGNL